MRKQYWHIARSQWAAGRYEWLPRQALKYVFSYLSRWTGKPLTGPILGTIVATYRCNHRCFMCDSVNRACESTQHGRQELDTTAMVHILDDFAALGTTGVGFTGGEPLLRDDIFILLAHSKKLGMITHLNTNGFLLTPERMQRLLDIGIDSINLSLDGATPATHDTARRTPGSFQRILKAVEWLIEQRAIQRVPVTINFVSVLSKQNLHELDALVALTKAHSMDGIGFIPVHEYYADFQQDQHALLTKESGLSAVENVTARLIALKQAGEPIENSMRYLQLFPRCFRGEPLPIQCLAGTTSYVVDCYGDIFPCVPWNNWNRPVQNVQQVSLKAFWSSQEYNQMRRTRITGCRECYWNCHTEMNLLFHPRFQPKNVTLTT